MSLPNLEQQLARILAQNPNTDLISQVKHIESYESQIERELLNKSKQISTLHHRLKSQIENIHAVMDQNGQLLKERDYLSAQLKKYTSKKQVDHAQQTDQCLKIESQTSQQSVEGIKDWRCKKLIKNEQTDLKSLRLRIQTLQKELQIERKANAQILKQLLSKEEREEKEEEREEEKEEEREEEREEEKEEISRGCLQQPEMLGKAMAELKANKLKPKTARRKDGCQYQNGLAYEGKFENGKRDGLGTLTFGGLEIYRGYWKKDLFEGKGVLHFPQETYSGHFKAGLKHGLGTTTKLNGEKIIQNWVNGVQMGVGFNPAFPDLSLWRELIQSELPPSKELNKGLSTRRTLQV